MERAVRGVSGGSGVTGCCDQVISTVQLSESLKMASKSSRKIVDDDLANVEFETSEDVEVIPTFDSMGLREDLLR